jgi:hypothetical protein
MIDGAHYNEQVKPAEVKVLNGMSVQADAGGSMGVAFLWSDSAFYGLQRPLQDPKGVLVTRVTAKGVAERKFGYDQLRDARAAGALEKLLEAAF